MEIDSILNVAVRGGASDIILKVGATPRFRLSAQLMSLADGQAVTAQMMQSWLQRLVPKHLQGELTQLKDLDFSYHTPTGYRFRVNVFRQQQNFAMVMRVISNTIKTLEELLLPEKLGELAALTRGLILVTGATGSGKSTSLAAMIERINLSKPAHIITIEDPIEYTFQEKMATINQREVGVDTADFPSALRSALRQNPNVILVGELRDRSTVETALMAAETGHLVFATLHTQDAVESLTRLLFYFPSHQHHQIRLSLSHALQAVISQRLVARCDQQGMVPAVEIMINNARISDLIMTNKISEIPDVIAGANQSYGMQSFDLSILHFYQLGIINDQTALEAASNPNDMRRLMQGIA